MPESSAGESSTSTRALKIAVSICSIVPMSAGAAGVLLGPGFFGGSGAESADLDGHFRYLSGLLLGIGLAYASGVPGIERRQSRFLLLGAIVVVGGLGRLLSVLLMGDASPTMIFALTMELVVTPSLTIWQRRIAR